MTSRTPLDTKPQGNTKLAILVIVLGIFSLLNLGLTGFFGIANLFKDGGTTLVQLNDGTTVSAETVAKNYRSPETISLFVEEIYTALYTTSGYLTATQIGQELQPDPGVLIANERRVATASWSASFGLEPRLREEILQELAEIIPQSAFARGKSLILIPNHIGTPVADPERQGYWSVNFVSTLVAFENEKSLGKAIPNNKKIYLRAVSPPKYKGTSDTEKTIAEVRKAGLEIYDVQPLSRQELEAAHRQQY